jgi:predicted  nucleic acid-binding Zn-ribbon protein
MANSVTSFVKTVMARLQGDTDQVIAIKNERLATSAIETQIALKKGEVVEMETKVEDAREALADVMYPTTTINRDTYVRDLLQAKNNLQDKEDELEAVKETLKYLEDTLKSFK